MNEQYTNPARNLHSAMQKVFGNINYWEPQEVPWKEILEASL